MTDDEYGFLELELAEIYADASRFPWDNPDLMPKLIAVQQEARRELAAWEALAIEDYTSSGKVR